MHIFFFNETATTEIYTLSLHDALPIWHFAMTLVAAVDAPVAAVEAVLAPVSASSGLHLSVWSVEDDALPPMAGRDRKSTRLNSSHGYISYAVFCLKKKNTALNSSR